jgi:hypothetical protein
VRGRANAVRQCAVRRVQIEPDHTIVLGLGAARNCGNVQITFFGATQSPSRPVAGQGRTSALCDARKLAAESTGIVKPTHDLVLRGLPNPSARFPTDCKTSPRQLDKREPLATPIRAALGRAEENRWANVPTNHRDRNTRRRCIVGCFARLAREVAFSRSSERGELRGAEARALQGYARDRAGLVCAGQVADFVGGGTTVEPE